MPALRRSRPPRASSAPIAISLRKYRSAEPGETRAAAASAAGSIHLPAAATRRQSCWDRSGGTAQARRLSKRAGARAARSGTPHGPRNCSTATTPERAPGRVAATSRRTADKAASARGSNCGDKTGRWDETSRTAPEPAMVKSVPPASDSASVTAARTGRSTKTVPLAVTTITIPTGTDNRVEWPALGPTRNLGKLPDAMTCRSTAPRLIEPSVTAGCAPETCAANIRFNVGLRGAYRSRLRYVWTCAEAAESAADRGAAASGSITSCNGRGASLRAAGAATDPAHPMTARTTGSAAASGSACSLAVPLLKCDCQR